MKTVIIEDEELASRRLKNLLFEIDPDIQVFASLDSIEKSVQWFSNNPLPELIFMDIQLSDGLSFEIFKKVNIDSPVIFTTAYHEYAIQAFKVNSIDYLLKPIALEDLVASMEKFKKLSSTENLKLKSKEVEAVLSGLFKNTPVFKSRFIVKSGKNFLKILSDEIAYFYVQNKMTFMMTKTGKKYITDLTMDELERELDPHLFFRANRQFLISEACIQNFQSYFSGKIKVSILPKYDEEIIISRLKANGFKDWLNG
jgi:DNA-binding LytR/AlgR family response regulator